MRVQIGGEYIFPVADFENRGAMSKLHNHFDRGILEGTDHAG